MTTAALIYPHQLFADHPALANVGTAVLVEDPLFFTQYAFHRQKLAYHRATMKLYAERLRRRSVTVRYVDAAQLIDSGSLARLLADWNIRSAIFVDPCDDWLEQRLTAALAQQNIAATMLEDPAFLTPRRVLDDFTRDKRKLFFTEFYIAQRKRLGLLLDDDGKPLGGQWSFDPENRKKLPKGVAVPPSVLDTSLELAGAATHGPAASVGSRAKGRAARESSATEGTSSETVREALDYVRRAFPRAIGNGESLPYPLDHAAAASWLRDFIAVRLPSFGDYEDAISQRHAQLFHSVLTPMLNIGLITPRQVFEAACERAAERGDVPLNSLEGFVRQVIGWREYVRLVYRWRGRRQRTRNFWGLERAMPAAFYDGTTGIEPVDHVIRQVLRTGYCHHIERLMILGNLLLLCDVSPDAVYQWFMELFIDAYDWVMVPNVYGMSQFADGGLMTTKPYISGSAYVLKMSDFTKGPWCPVWDALYWRFIDRQSDFFRSNPRMAVMVKMKEKLGAKMAEHHRVADRFLSRLGTSQT
jgi:deoxyribodipyrimidine photolyase-related protein